MGCRVNGRVDSFYLPGEDFARQGVRRDFHRIPHMDLGVVRFRNTDQQFHGRDLLHNKDRLAGVHVAPVIIPGRDNPADR